jgi:hypothetical protein
MDIDSTWQNLREAGASIGAKSQRMKAARDDEPFVYSSLGPPDFTLHPFDFVSYIALRAEIRGFRRESLP